MSHVGRSHNWGKCSTKIPILDPTQKSHEDSVCPWKLALYLFYYYFCHRFATRERLLQSGGTPTSDQASHLNLFTIWLEEEVFWGAGTHQLQGLEKSWHGILSQTSGAAWGFSPPSRMLYFCLNCWYDSFCRPAVERVFVEYWSYGTWCWVSTSLLLQMCAARSSGWADSHLWQTSSLSAAIHLSLNYELPPPDSAESLIAEEGGYVAHFLWWTDTCAVYLLCYRAAWGGIAVRLPLQAPFFILAVRTFTMPLYPFRITPKLILWFC